MQPGDEGELFGKGDGVFKAPIAVGIGQHANPREGRLTGGRTERIMAELRHPQAAEFIKADRHWVDHIRLGGDQFDGEILLGEHELLFRFFRRERRIAHRHHWGQGQPTRQEQQQRQTGRKCVISALRRL